MAPYQKTNASCRAPSAPAFAGATAQQPSSKKACQAEAAEQRRLVGLGRLELPTSRLSSARSNQLSYKPDEASSSGLQPNGAKPRRKKEGKRGRRQGANCLITMLGWREPPETSILRKEVIQPQVPLRLPCYDFGPVADPTVAGCLPCGLAHRLKVEPTPMP